MQTLLDCLIDGQNKNLLWTLVYKPADPDIHISFLLFDTREGIFYGSRTYRTHTVFLDTHDLLDDLWAGSLDSVSVPVSACKHDIKNNPLG